MGASSCANRINWQVTELQILCVLLDVGNCVVDRLGYRRPIYDVVCSFLFNGYSARIMVTVKVGQHTIEMYDAIDELPIVRFHKYQKLLLVDAGIGSDIAAFDQRIERTRRFLMAGKNDKAQQELENLRQGVFLIQNGINPKHRAFAVLVTKIDGKECNDISDDAITKLTELLNDVPVKDLTAPLDAVKKKIDNELLLYFPRIFNDSTVKEYYDILRKRTLEILNGIIAGNDHPDATTAVDKLTTELITYSNPQSFSGSDGVEIQFDRQFENLCLILSEQLHVRPKDYTVMEFYNAFDFVQERAKEREKAQKRADKRR